MAPPPKQAAPPKLSDVKDIIDESTFEQILEMDDDDEREFSHSIVYGFFTQADETFKKMENALTAKDLVELSALGHFLKGSSATLGLTHVKDACEKIQNFGAGKDETGAIDEPDSEVSLKNIDITLKDVKIEYAKVEKFLRLFFGEQPEPEEPKPAEAEKKDETKDETKDDKKEQPESKKEPESAKEEESKQEEEPEKK
ncbi:signal transduction histidine kinase [Penicillium taxi]|uniref:signal transduction histidine kinase n=1 Tax=Penicillium taxi TaxID=168475 RepID=UPI002545A644|nr:signal transduction histidine kinase [Penicillium taxi]KAJ5899743.1 signal transduction histidine kinase [Penicillium taxi]